MKACRRLIREIQIAVYNKYRVILTAVGVYSVNTKDEKIAAIEKKVRSIVSSHEHVLQMHGFYLNEETSEMRFDVVISFNAANRRDTYMNIIKDVQNSFPDYKLQVALDTDFSEE